MLIVKQNKVGACVAVMVERTEGDVVTAIREGGDIHLYYLDDGPVTVYSPNGKIFLMEFKGKESDADA